MPNTDVKHSIAGYVYQLMLACNELAKLLAEGKADHYGVAIEKGSDVRVLNENQTYIEAKFYKATSFTKNAVPIRHTIYNFYHSYKKLKETNATFPNFIFSTNVPVNQKNKLFFEAWSNNTYQDDSSYIQYVKDCLVYETYYRPNVADNFKLFKQNYPITDKDPTDGDYVKKLVEYLHKNPDQYSLFADPEGLLDELEFRKFIENVKFEFPETWSKKFDHIEMLKNEFKKMVKKEYGDLSDADLDVILNLVIDRFLSTTISSEEKSAIDQDYLTVEDLRYLVENCRTEKLNYLDQAYKDDFFDDLDTILRDYEENLIEDGFGDKKEELLMYLIELCEQLSDEMDNHGVKHVANRYVMDTSTPSPHVVLSLFQAMAEIASESQKELGTAQIYGLGGFNNFSYKDHQSFVLQGYPNHRQVKKHKNLMTKFIRHTQERISGAIGDETIVFEADNQPCEFNKELIKSIVFDIGNVEDAALLQRNYQGFTYKCTECLRLNSDRKDCEFAKMLRGEGVNVGENARVNGD